jgi:hypothetical protein
MTPALPPEIETLLDVCVRTSMNYRTTGQSPERERYDAARAALESAILSALAASEERARAALEARDVYRAKYEEADAQRRGIAATASYPVYEARCLRDKAVADATALRSERDALAKALREAVRLLWGQARDLKIRGERDEALVLVKGIKRVRAATPSSPRTAGARHAE